MGEGSRVGGLLPSLRVLARPQVHSGGGPQPQPSWQGQGALISISPGVGERVWCWSGPWNPKMAWGSRVQALVGEGPVGGRGQQGFRGGQQLMVEPDRGPGGRG